MAVGAVVLLSLWASLGSADPESAGSTSDPDTEESAEDSESTEDAESTPEAESTETTVAAVEEKPWVGLDYELLSDNAEAMTELQFDDFAAEFVGTEIGWHGKVVEARESLFGEGFEVIVDVRGGDGVLERAHLQTTKELALAIPNEAQIYFTGTLVEFDNTFSLTVNVDNVMIEGSDGTQYAAGDSGSSDPVVEAAASSTDPSDYDAFSTNAQNMTELQFAEWVSQFLGTQITWTGEVERVEESLFDEGFEIVVDVEGGTGIGERATLLVTRDEALTANQGAKITFTGTLEEANNLISLGTKFKSVTFTTE